MKKLLIAAAILLAATFSLNAQDGGSGAVDFTSFGGKVESGNIIVDAGIALDTGFIGTLGYYIPRVSVSGEYALQCGPAPLSFGLEIAYMGSRSQYFYTTAGATGNRVMDTHNNLFFNLIVNYHINILAVDNLDVYAGPRLGLRLDIVNHTDHHYDPAIGGYIDNTTVNTLPLFDAGGVIGATWYFSDSFGVNAEVGFPVFLRGGVTFKF